MPVHSSFLQKCFWWTLGAVAALGCLLLGESEILNTTTPWFNRLSLIGTLATLAGLGYAIFQTILATRAAKLQTQTLPIINSSEILGQFYHRISDKDHPVDQIYFLANTIAVGATGRDAGKMFPKFRESLLEQMTRLKKDFHIAYAELEFEPSNAAAGGQRVLSSKSIEMLKSFYTDIGVETRNLPSLIGDTAWMHAKMQEANPRYCPLPDAKSDGPHFILVNPTSRNSDDRLGIIWSIRRKGTKGEVATVGFRTTNQQILKTMIGIFNERCSPANKPSSSPISTAPASLQP